MKPTLKPSRMLPVFAGLLCFWQAGNTAAQPAIFTYDNAGNPTVVTVAVSAPPVIITAPSAQLLESNSAATYSVVATGSGLSYQWLSNGIAIAGATGDSLLLTNLALIGTNVGNFSVIISNGSGSITSAPAALWPDINGNDIPDWWEMKYFGNLNQPALGDYDHDGVDNLDEYLEGTNPNNAFSFNPRLYIQAAHGYVAVSPDQPHYTMGQLVTLTAVPDAGQGFVGWSGAASGAKSSISLFMNTNEFITATFGMPLGVALDDTNLIWTTTGNQLWFGQAEVSEDGVSSAQSGPIVSYYDGANFVGDQTSLQTSFYISQPEQLSFWWDVSSEPPDGVTFSINGSTNAMLSGEAVAWQYMQTNLPAGGYTLTWTYSKGPVNIPDGLAYTDAAWVDQVVLTAVSIAPPPPPVLDIRSLNANAALLFWPASSNTFRLQQAATLTPATWVNATNAVVTANGTNQVPVTPTGKSLFYRLVYP